MSPSTPVIEPQRAHFGCTLRNMSSMLVLPQCRHSKRISPLGSELNEGLHYIPRAYAPIGRHRANHARKPARCPVPRSAYSQRCPAAPFVASAMTGPKRLMGFRLRGIDASGAQVTFALETAGGELHEFAAADEVFGALVRFLDGIEDSLLQRKALGRGSPAPEARADPLEPSEDTDIVIDLTGDRPLLKLRTGPGRQL